GSRIFSPRVKWAVNATQMIASHADPIPRPNGVRWRPMLWCKKGWAIGDCDMRGSPAGGEDGRVAALVKPKRPGIVSAPVQCRGRDGSGQRSSPDAGDAGAPEGKPVRVTVATQNERR